MLTPFESAIYQRRENCFFTILKKTTTSELLFSILNFKLIKLYNEQNNTICTS